MLTYLYDNFELSPEAKRLISNAIDWASEHYEDKNGNITKEGVHFLTYVVGAAIGLTAEEISDNWKED